MTTSFGLAFGPVDVVSQHGNAARPFSLAALGGDLVADAFADDLALELGERQQNVQRQSAHRVGRIELLRDRDERHAVVVERLHDPREVEKRTAQAIDLVDDHAVDFAGVNIGQQAIEGRPIHAAAGEAAIVVVIRQTHPAFVLLAGDERLGRLALGIERVEFQVEAFFAGLAGVDRTTNCLRFWLFLAAHLFPHRRKNVKPLMCEPVIALAMADSDR